jgi:transcriptional regulator
MYVPEHFQETRLDELHRLISEHPLGALVTCGPNGLDACHLPFLLDPDAGELGSLRAHVARANPVWREVREGDDVLVIFGGAQAYISPGWYPSKHESHRQVPTWNYQAVHVRGGVHVRDDERFVRGVVARLTRAHEVRTGAARPWKMTDSPQEYIDGLLAGVVGIEIDVTSIVGSWKVSQNKEERDRAGAAEELRVRGAREMAEAMLAAAERRG